MLKSPPGIDRKHLDWKHSALTTTLSRLLPDIRESKHVSIVWLHPDQGNHHVPFRRQYCGMRVFNVRGITDRMKGYGGSKKTPGRTVWRIKKLMVSKRWREIDKNKKLSKQLMQSISKRFLEFIWVEGRQAPKRIIKVISEILVIFCEILCNRHHFNSLTFLIVYLLTDSFSHPRQVSILTT